MLSFCFNQRNSANGTDTGGDSSIFGVSCFSFLILSASGELLVWVVGGLDSD